MEEENDTETFWILAFFGFVYSVICYFCITERIYPDIYSSYINYDQKINIGFISIVLAAYTIIQLFYFTKLGVISTVAIILITGIILGLGKILWASNVLDVIKAIAPYSITVGLFLYSTLEYILAIVRHFAKKKEPVNLPEVVNPVGEDQQYPPDNSTPLPPLNNNPTDVFKKRDR